MLTTLVALLATTVITSTTVFLPIVTSDGPVSQVSQATQSVMFEDGSYRVYSETGIFTGCVQNTICDENGTDQIVLDTAHYTSYYTENGHYVYGFDLTGHYASDLAPVAGYQLCSGNVCETYFQQVSVE